MQRMDEKRLMSMLDELVNAPANLLDLAFWFIHFHTDERLQPLPRDSDPAMDWYPRTLNVINAINLEVNRVLVDSIYAMVGCGIDKKTAMRIVVKACLERGIHVCESCSTPEEIQKMYQEQDKIADKTIASMSSEERLQFERIRRAKSTDDFVGIAVDSFMDLMREKKGARL